MVLHLLSQEIMARALLGQISIVRLSSRHGSFQWGRICGSQAVNSIPSRPRQTPYGQRQNYIPSLGSEVRENLAWLLLSTFTGSATLEKVLNLSELQFQCL